VLASFLITGSTAFADHAEPGAQKQHNPPQG